MSADTMLLALPNTIDNREVAEYLTWVRRFADDDTYRDVDTGESLDNVAGPTRIAYEDAFYAEWPSRYEHCELGPTYWGDRITDESYDVVQEYLRQPIVITPARRAELMVIMSQRYGPYRAYWNQPRRGLGPGLGKVGRSYVRHLRGYRRVTRLQDVRRWLDSHDGWLVWAEAW